MKNQFKILVSVILGITQPCVPVLGMKSENLNQKIFINASKSEEECTEFIYRGVTRVISQLLDKLTPYNRQLSDKIVYLYQKITPKDNLSIHNISDIIDDIINELKNNNIVNTKSDINNLNDSIIPDLKVHTENLKLISDACKSLLSVGNFSQWNSFFKTFELNYNNTELRIKNLKEIALQEHLKYLRKHYPENLVHLKKMSLEFRKIGNISGRTEITVNPDTQVNEDNEHYLIFYTDNYSEIKRLLGELLEASMNHWYISNADRKIISSLLQGNYNPSLLQGVGYAFTNIPFHGLVADISDLFSPEIDKSKKFSKSRT